jgi:hypothetical protein
MKLENFIRNAVTNIEKSANKTNKDISDISFELFVDIKGSEIFVQDAKTIKESKKNLNKIKVSLKTINQNIGIEKLFNDIDKEK